ncbi:MAG: tripartite tricarboxylate transporter TctB family protein [Bacillota bacterium]
MGADFAVAIFMLALAGVFWAQRNYMTPFGGIWPDAILVALAAVSALLLVRTAAAAFRARSRRSPAADPAPAPASAVTADPSQAAPDPLAWVLGISAALAAWLFVFWKLGYVAGGALGFAGLATLLARAGRTDWKLWVRALAAGAAWVLVLYLAFGRMLGVPLPFGWWAGRF